MSVLYIVLPLALLVAGSAVAAFMWVVRSGQLDDVDTPPRRILFDEQAAGRGPVVGPEFAPEPDHREDASKHPS